MSELFLIMTHGETGVDQAALRVARKLDLPIGGYAFEHWMTDEGMAPWLEGCGLMPTVKYKDQYGVNVADSDGTLIFGQLTGGSKLVSHMCQYAETPWMHVAWPQWSSDPWKVGKWIRDKGIGVLNIAGNRERKNPGIGVAVEEFLSECLRVAVEGDKRKF